MLPDSPALQGIAQPHPLEATIRAQNARRVQQRAAYSSLANSVMQTDFDALRRDPRRQIGGTFESLQEIPEAEVDPSGNISQEDINSFLSAFSFQATADVVPHATQTLYGGSVFG